MPRWNAQRAFRRSWRNGVRRWSWSFARWSGRSSTPPRPTTWGPWQTTCATWANAWSPQGKTPAWPAGTKGVRRFEPAVPTLSGVSQVRQLLVAPSAHGAGADQPSSWLFLLPALSTGFLPLGRERRLGEWLQSWRAAVTVFGRRAGALRRRRGGYAVPVRQPAGRRLDRVTHDGSRRRATPTATAHRADEQPHAG